LILTISERTALPSRLIAECLWNGEP